MIVIDKKTNEGHFFKSIMNGAGFLGVTRKTVYEWKKEANMKPYKDYIIYFDVIYYPRQNRGVNPR